MLLADSVAPIQTDAAGVDWTAALDALPWRDAMASCIQDFVHHAEGVLCRL
jgi:hypothetical protein